MSEIPIKEVVPFLKVTNAEGGRMAGGGRMKIVIDIPKELYEEIICDEACGLNEITRAIANGTLLPKGHGRLIDADELLDTFWTYCKQGDFGYHQAEDLIKSASPIVEADGGEENGIN